MYFQSVGNYFQKELHDKLMVGLLALHEAITMKGTA